MTPRTPRTTRTNRLPDLRCRSERFRSLSAGVTRNVSRKKLACAGAGLALAGTGAAVAAGCAATSASAATVQRRAAAHAGHARTTSSRSRAHAHRAAAARRAGNGKPATRKPAASHGHAQTSHAQASHAQTSQHRTWAAVSKIIAGRTFPRPAHGGLPARDKLTPAGTSGPQTWMPITTARYHNAKVIITQALAKHMGLRAAVIAVATSMQESGLLDLGYGDADSLGLFQQRPSCGWGTASQILHPAYAADAFLKALHGYETRDPAWARQPLWQSAQGVQASGYPTAYAKWEAQAAHLVSTIAKKIV